MRWALVAAVVAACSSDAPPPAKQGPAITEAEIKRGADACAAYVAQICACTSTSGAQKCALAKALPEAIEITRRLAQNPKADAEDSFQAAISIRKTIKECIDSTAALATAGCP